MKPAWRFASLVAAASLVFAGLAGCGAPAQSTGSAKPQTNQKSNTDSSSTSKKSSSDDSDTQAPKTDPTDTSQTCTTSSLTAKLTIGGGGGGGSAYPYLVLTNSGENTCTVEGFPGVSLMASGKQIGAAATRDDAITPQPVVLKPGESAHSPLKIVNADNFDTAACEPQAADTMRVFPPDQKNALNIPTSEYQGCQNTNTAIIAVQALQPGEN